MKDPVNLKPSLRGLSLAQRRELLTTSLPMDAMTRNFFESQNPDRELADLMTENALGYMEVPLGLVNNFPVNGKLYTLPLATEEPSVIAAATYAGRILGRSGGITAQGDDNVMTAQVFLEMTGPDTEAALEKNRSYLENLARDHLASMEKRGGGLRSLTWKFLPLTQTWEINLSAAVCDAMGANLLNTLAEALAPPLERVTGGRKILAILSNDGSGRLARAQFKIDLDTLAKPGIPGPEMGRRIVLAGKIAQEEPLRAITHNKGIMNGISALALATGNDTRALEAGAHAWAARSGQVRGLTEYEIQGHSLLGKIELPVTLATVGGALEFHPTTRWALDLLGSPSARELGALGAALGLGQNFAALFALTGEGIQAGHMALHQRRKEYLDKKKESNQ